APHPALRLLLAPLGVAQGHLLPARGEKALDRGPSSRSEGHLLSARGEKALDRGPSSRSGLPRATFSPHAGRKPSIEVPRSAFAGRGCREAAGEGPCNRA